MESVSHALSHTRAGHAGVPISISEAFILPVHVGGSPDQVNCQVFGFLRSLLDCPRAMQMSQLPAAGCGAFKASATRPFQSRTGKRHNGVLAPHRAIASLPPATRKATQPAGLRCIQARRLIGLKVGRPVRRGLAWAAEPLS